MKKTLLFAFALIFLGSCSKQELNIEKVSNPSMFVKVEAVHSTGEIVTSNIVYIR